VHEHVHKEVLKLYPDAELPSFATERDGDSTLIMHYKSSGKMGDFAYGLIVGCLKHFGEEATISAETIDEEGSNVVFTIIKK
jgi:hypothetical protein